MSEATPTSRRARHENENHESKRKKLWFALIASAVVVLAAVLILEFTGGSSTPVVSQSIAESPSPDKPKAPKPTGVYEQPGLPAGAVAPTDALSVEVSGDGVGEKLPEGLVGLSLEVTDLASPAVSADNPSLVNSLNQLSGPMLRFGGNSTERRGYWTSSGEPLPARIQASSTQPAAAITPEDLQRVKGLLEATDSTIAIVVDLANFEPERAADFVKNAKEIFGDRFLGYTPGNEPNGYESNGMRPEGWGDAGYLEDAKKYAEAIAKVAPDVPIIGPGTYSMGWGEAFAKTDFATERIFAFHHYPFSSCEGEDPAGKPTISNMVNRENRDNSVGFRQRFMNVAHEAGLRVWIPEMGPSACQGNKQEMTKTHSLALWYVDYALSSAQLGVEKLGFHSSLQACAGGPSMSPVCNTGSMTAPSGDFQTRANFWGQSFVAGLGTGDFLQTIYTGDSQSYAYAIKKNDDEIDVVIVNTNDPSTTAQTEVRITLPFFANRGTMAQLYGPALSAEDSTMIDGQFAAMIPEAERPGIPGFDEGEKLSVALNPGSATVLTFRR